MSEKNRLQKPESIREMFKKNLLILFVLLSLNIFADSIRVIVPDGLPALSIVNMVSTTKEIDGKKINYKIEKLSDALVVNMLKREGDIEKERKRGRYREGGKGRGGKAGGREINCRAENRERSWWHQLPRHLFDF